jgi:hypothetical protein
VHVGVLVATDVVLGNRGAKAVDGEVVGRLLAQRETHPANPGHGSRRIDRRRLRNARGAVFH